MNAPQIRARRWWILGVLTLALFGVSLDNTILNVALPTLARDLGATASQLQWMVDSYILVFAGMLLVAGALSDRYGRRLALVVGLALFGLGSALAPFVQTAEQLIVLRAFMGLGAAFTMPSTLSIIGDVFEADERPKAIAVWSSVSGLGIVVGPVLGGWLLEHFAWGSVFLINVPFVIVGIVAALAIIPESRAPGRTPLDPIGALLSIVGLATLVYGIIEIPAQGWDDPLVLGSLAAAAIFLTSFFVWERRIAHPMLDVRLFSQPTLHGGKPERDARLLLADGRPVLPDAVPAGRARPVGVRHGPSVHPDRDRRDRSSRRSRPRRPRRSGLASRPRPAS